MGIKMTKMSNSRGLCVDMSSGLVVILASAFGLPVSSTQTVTGAIVGVGLFDGAAWVNWKILAKIFLGWVLTLVVTASSAAVVTAWAVYAPSRGAVEARAAAIASINASTLAFADLLKRGAGAGAAGGGGCPAVGRDVLGQWAVEIKVNLTRRLRAPQWSVDAALGALNFSCQRGYIAAGLLRPDEAPAPLPDPSQMPP